MQNKFQDLSNSRYTGLNQSFLMDHRRINIEASTRCNLLCPGCSRTKEMEQGKGLAGGIGDGKGKWRLTVSSDEPVTVQSLLETPAGFITNLSTSAQ